MNMEFDQLVAQAQHHLSTGHNDEARSCGEQALDLKPGHSLALLVTGVACAAQGDLEAADVLLSQAVDKRPDDAHAFIHLARVCMRKQIPQRAELLFRQARKIAPRLAAAGVGLGNALLRQARHDDAEHIFATVYQQYPGDIALLNQVGNMYRTVNCLELALKYYRMALAARPDSAEILNNIANILQAQSRLSEADRLYQQAIQLKPGFWQAHSNRLLLMNYLPETCGQHLFDAHRNWAKQHTSRLKQFTTWETPVAANRPLRVAYLSPDFHHHPVSAFMLPVFIHHDPRRVTAIGLSDALKVDDVTRELQAASAEWYTVKSLDDNQLSGFIRKQRIDILIDLAGHSGQHRLKVFARKPAPVQITYLGYPATTGLGVIDFRLTDHWADPPGESDTHYSERLLRIPSGFLCYQPDKESPPVSPPPSSFMNRITFGSLNNLSKVNAPLVAIWAKILSELPGSRLLIKNLALSDASVRQHYLQLFESQGITRDRIDLRSRVHSYAEHLATYNDIDIALDTFPYNGTTTTCEALWMGVPVITMTGRIHAGRVGHSLLNQVQCPELIARDKQHYIQLAIALARQPDRLRQLRKQLREQVAQSSLCDGATFTRELETLYASTLGHQEPVTPA